MYIPNTKPKSTHLRTCTSLVGYILYNLFKMKQEVCNTIWHTLNHHCVLKGVTIDLFDLIF